MAQSVQGWCWRLSQAGLALLVLLPLGSLQAAAAPPLVVGVVENAMPCSNRQGSLYGGQAVELWEAIAAQNSWRYRFVPAATPDALIAMAAAGAVDVGVSCLNEAPERLAIVSFSTPYRDDSLAFLSKRPMGGGFSKVLGAMVKDAVLQRSLLALFLVSLLGAGVLWCTCGRFSHNDVQCNGPRSTFFKGWIMLLMGSGVYKMSGSAWATVVVLCTTLLRLVIISIFVGETAKTLIRQSEPADASEIQLLQRKLQEGVAVDQGTIAELWLRQQLTSWPQARRAAARMEPVSGDEGLLAALRSGRVGSVFADAARIDYLRNVMLSPSEQRSFVVTAALSSSMPQGFVFGRNLPLAQQRAISVAIAQLRFQGDLGRLMARQP